MPSSARPTSEARATRGREGRKTTRCGRRPGARTHECQNCRNYASSKTRFCFAPFSVRHVHLFRLQFFACTVHSRVYACVLAAAACPRESAPSLDTSSSSASTTVGLFFSSTALWATRTLVAVRLPACCRCLYSTRAPSTIV